MVSLLQRLQNELLESIPPEKRQHTMDQMHLLGSGLIDKEQQKQYMALSAKKLV